MERKQYQVIGDFYDDDDDINDDDNNVDDSDEYDDMILMATIMMTMMMAMTMITTLIQVGETAHLSCSVQRSSPPSLLSWYINDEPVCIIITIFIIINIIIIFKISGT